MARRLGELVIPAKASSPADDLHVAANLGIQVVNFAGESAARASFSYYASTCRTTASILFVGALFAGNGTLQPRGLSASIAGGVMCVTAASSLPLPG